ncbi:MAG: hypothetical protein ACTHJ3_10565 [Pararhizobium sp.]
MDADVLNKWSSPTDQAALDFLIERAGPALALADRKFTGGLPDAVEEHRRSHGAPLLVKMHGQDLPLRDDATDLTRLLPSAFLDDLPAPIRALMQVDGRTVGIPVAVHRANSLFMSEPALAGADLGPPETLDELMAAVRRLAQRSIRPFALVADPMLLGFLFEDLALAVGGPDFHRALFAEADASAVEAEAFSRTCDLWTEIVGLGLGAEGSWREAGDAVKRGEAAFFACGDFATASMLADAEATSVRETAFPGTEHAFVFIADFFTPIGFDTPEAEEALRAMIGFWSAEAAVSRFCSLKRALPVSRSVDLAPAEDLVRGKQAHLRAALARGAFNPSFTLEQAAPARLRDPVLTILGEAARSRADASALRSKLTAALG